MLMLWVGILSIENIAVADERIWQLQGLRIVRHTEHQATLIDVKRANSQQARGCVPDPRVRFGYSAPMRQTAPHLHWTMEQRQALASAAFLDDADAALERIEGVLKDQTLDINQRAVVENDFLLTCLIFGDSQCFSRRLAKVRPDGMAAPAIRADRLFLRAYELSQNARNSRDWQQSERFLVKAQQLDPSFFSVRVQRVANWLLTHRGSEAGGHCAREVRELSDLVLDLSDAAPCAQLTGNVSHYLSRVLQDESNYGVGQPVVSALAPGGQWRLLQTAILAHVTRQNELKKAAMRSLERTSGGACVGEIRIAIGELNQ